jgi:hypothetical protein
MVACPYCGQTSFVGPAGGLEAQEAPHPLVDYGSMLRVGLVGTLGDRRWEVLGRVRFDYPDGFWDEWLLMPTDGAEEPLWLQEDEGKWVLFELAYKIKDPSSFPSFDNLRVSHERLIAPDFTFYALERQSSRLKGAEGQLPFRMLPGEPIDFIDGIWKQQGRPACIEYTTTGIEVYVGVRFTPQTIAQFAGWVYENNRWVAPAGAFVE